jgi:hypothetical protein
MTAWTWSGRRFESGTGPIAGRDVETDQLLVPAERPLAQMSAGVLEVLLEIPLDRRPPGVRQGPRIVLAQESGELALGLALRAPDRPPQLSRLPCRRILAKVDDDRPGPRGALAKVAPHGNTTSARPPS